MKTGIVQIYVMVVMGIHNVSHNTSSKERYCFLAKVPPYSESMDVPSYKLGLLCSNCSMCQLF